MTTLRWTSVAARSARGLATARDPALTGNSTDGAEGEGNQCLSPEPIPPQDGRHEGADGSARQRSGRVVRAEVQPQSRSEKHDTQHGRNTVTHDSGGHEKRSFLIAHAGPMNPIHHRGHDLASYRSGVLMQ